MKKKFTTLIILSLLVLGAYYLITISLNNFLSGPRLKAMLISPAEKALGKNIKIGAIKVSLFKGISITNLVVKEQNSEDNLASIDSFTLNYDLLPLFEGKLVIKSMQIEQPKINIIKNKNGTYNLSDNGKTKQPENKIADPEDDFVDPLPMALTFESIIISKGAVTFTDMTGALPNIDANADASLSLVPGKDLASTLINGTISILANGSYKDQKPVLMLEGNFNQKALAFQGNVSMAFERLRFNGLVANYTTRPDIKLNVTSTKLDLDNIAALFSSAIGPEKSGAAYPTPAEPEIPETEHLELAETAAPDPVQGETLSPESVGEEPVIEPEKAPAPTPKPKPASNPNNISCLGEITISELVSKEFKANNIKLFYSFKDDVVTVKNFNAELFGGNLAGNIIVDLKGPEPTIGGDIKTKKIKTSELLERLGKPAESLSGALTTTFIFTGTGLKWSSLQNSLTGEGDYLLADGGLKSPITAALSVLLDVPELDDLRYNDLSGSFKVFNGNVLLNASLSGSQLDMKADGNIGLNGSLDIPLTLYLSQEYSQKLSEKSSFSNYLADEQGRLSLHLSLKGSTSDPKLRFDEEAALKQTQEVVIKKAEEELGRVISKELGKNPEAADIVKDLSGKFLNEMFKK